MEQPKHREKRMRKGFFGLTLSPMLLALCWPVEAQLSAKVRRIGVLTPTTQKISNARTIYKWTEFSGEQNPPTCQAALRFTLLIDSNLILHPIADKTSMTVPISRIFAF